MRDKNIMTYFGFSWRFYRRLFFAKMLYCLHYLCITASAKLWNNETYFYEMLVDHYRDIDINIFEML
jgi:hypothetical protein